MLNAQQTTPAAQVEALHIYFASQTGNGEGIAGDLGRMAGPHGLDVRVQSLNRLRPAFLRKLGSAVFVISTHGEGDPPDDAIELFEYLEGDSTPSLVGLNYRILALGDRSYREFCAAGRRLDTLLSARGARPFAERVECDVDFHAAATAWSSEVIAWGVRELGGGTPSGEGPAPPVLNVVPPAPSWNRKRPFPAVLRRVQPITGEGSDKDVRHLELSLEGSGLCYQPGDSLGVWASNDPETVSGILSRLRIAPARVVVKDGIRRTIRDWLTHHLEITRLNPETLHRFAGFPGGGTLGRRLMALDGARREAFIRGRQFADLVEEYPVRLEAGDLASLLPPLAPRSYSIASSHAAVGDEVHLTVATVRSKAAGKERLGLASGSLNHRWQPGDEVRVFLEPNRRFRLPDDRSIPLILVAAGTGIAPYRAFLQELEDDGASPDCWLVFGSRRLCSDFHYQRDWLRWRANGLVNRIDTAFSCDQDEKRYVQHVIHEEAGRVSCWLERGARIYVCGALEMGRAVEAAVTRGVAEHRGLDAHATAEFVAALRRERRILKDLY